MTYLKLSHSGLEWIPDTANDKYLIQNLDLSYNKISVLPSTFLRSFYDLKILDLSGNLFQTFDVSFLSISIQEFYINDNHGLTSLEHLQTPVPKDQLQIFSASKNPNLAHFCPWIIWSAIKLRKLNLAGNSNLILPHRIFKANEDLRQVLVDSVACDCSPPPDIMDQCDDNGKNVLLSTFRAEKCPRLPDKNSSSLQVSRVFEQPLELPSCAGDKSEHVMWITPLGKIFTSQDSEDCAKNNEIIGKVLPLRQLTLTPIQNNIR